MGDYLNNPQVFALYKSEVDSPYFVDKTMLLKILFPLVKAGNKHICITRPRRFGKSVMAEMVGAFFCRGMEGGSVFDSLKIGKKSKSEADSELETELKSESNQGLKSELKSETNPGKRSELRPEKRFELNPELKSELESELNQTPKSEAEFEPNLESQSGRNSEPKTEAKPEYLEQRQEELYDYHDYMNQYNVIYINFLNEANESSSYQEFIATIKQTLREDLREAYPNVRFRKKSTVVQDLGRIYEQTRDRFILIFDEWDCIFHKSYSTDEDRRNFINWLSAMTKDKGYVALSYMTGVLPIAKYSSGSTINNFQEYTMATDDLFSEYFGFTEAEVDELYARYEVRTPVRNISREDLKLWYDGYHTPSSTRMYNPRSVVEALTRNRIRSYWTATGAYGEIAAYIANDRANVKKDVALMVSGEAVSADVEEFAATSMQLTTRNELLSAMVVYGFLDYEDGKVHIPNRELMVEFAKTIRERENLGYIHRLAVESERMLEATLRGDTRAMEEILAFAHDTETPLLDYNNETELTAIVNLVYLAARDSYFVEREDKAGRGYVDFIFYPIRPGDDGMILELKVDDTPENAIQQIKNKGYPLKFRGKMASKPYTGQVRLAGIGYSRENKDHHCQVEVMQL